MNSYGLIPDNSPIAPVRKEAGGVSGEAPEETLQYRVRYFCRHFQDLLIWRETKWPQMLTLGSKLFADILGLLVEGESTGYRILTITDCIARCDTKCRSAHAFLSARSAA